MVEANRFDVVGVSIGTDRFLHELPGMFDALRERSRNRSIKIIVGGRLFSEQPELANSTGADATAGDGADAVRLAERLVRRTR